jgi:hypothetical protein
LDETKVGYGFVEFRFGNDTETLPHLIRRVTEISHYRLNPQSR